MTLAEPPAELRRQAQDSVRESVAAAAAPGRTGRRWVVPLAASAAVAAAACAPVVWPLLAAGGGAAAVAAAFGQVGGVGGGLLTEAVVRAWDRLRSRGQPSAGPNDLRDALAKELEAGLTLEGAAAAALRAEVAGVLRGVDAVQVALTATVRESAAGVREVLVRGLRELGEEFTEFGWVLDEVNRQLTVIAEDVARTAATTREVADNQQQTLVELALLRQEARSAFRSRPDLPDVAFLAGPSADEERAASLDAAGVPLSTDCPYLGLAAFQPEDAGRFYGRAQLTAELVTRAGEQLARPGLLMVLGPSGSGKSSLLRAGLLPAVAAGALPASGSWAWPRDLMTPGRRPLLELAARIGSLAGVPAGALEADLRTDPARVTGAIRQALLTHARRQAGLAPTAGDLVAGPRLVLIVDQFEEVFTDCADEPERRAFIAAVSAAGGPAALVVLGMRADFYARCTAYPELAGPLQDRQVLVGPVGEAGLREAIERPAAGAGLVVDAALVEVLLADLGLHASGSYAAGRLALLSYALQQTWRNREGRRLTVAGYRATGGIDGAVAQAADGVYDQLDPVRQDTVHRVLLRLVTLGEGTPDTRRRVDLAELTEPEDSEPAAATRAVLDDLIDARLVTADADTVEITHETLLTAWPRLRHWLTEDRAGLRIHADLTDAAHDWQHAGRDPGRLFRGTRLAVARDWAAGHDQDLNPGERAFLAASQHDQLRTTRRRRAAAAGLAVLTVLSLTAAGFALQQRGDALTARDQAIAGQVAAEAAQLMPANPSLAAQLDVVADRIDPTPDIQTQLLDTTTVPLADSLATPAGEISSVAVSKSGPILAAAGSAGVSLWSLADPARPARLGPLLASPKLDVHSVAFSADGQALAAGDANANVWLWNLADPARPGPAVRLGQTSTGPTGSVDSVAFSPDGRILAAGNEGGGVELWSLADPARPTQLGQMLITSANGGVDSVAFSQQGQILAAGDTDGTLWLWRLTDPARPAPLGRLPIGSANLVSSVAFSPDGSILAVGGSTVQLWNLTDPGRPVALSLPLNGPAAGVASVAFSPDGQTLAAGGFDGTIWLWNLTDPGRPAQLGQPLAGPTESVNSMAFAPDGRTLAAGNADGSVWLWNLPSGVLTGPAGSVQSVAFSRNGGTLAAGIGDTVWLWNLTNRAHPAQLAPPLVAPLGPGLPAGSMSIINSVALSPDGRTLAAGDADGTVRLWSLADPAQPTSLHSLLAGADDTVYSVAFSPEGQTLAAGDNDGNVWLWNVANPARPALLGVPLAASAGGVSSVAFSPDGRILAAGHADGTVWLWNVACPGHPDQLGRPLAGPASGVLSVAFSPDRRTLAVSGFDHRVWLWNVTDPAHPARLGSPLTGPTDTVFSVAFSPDGRILAVGSADRRVWLWDMTDPGQPTLLGQPLTGPTDTLYSVAFSPDGRTLAGGSGEGAVRLWDLDPADAIQRICATTGSILTPALWKQYVPLPYDPPCGPPGS